MLQARVDWKVKVFILLLVVLTGFTIASVIQAEAPVEQMAKLYGTNQTIRIDPQPELGFCYPYYLFIPDNTKTGTAVYLLVEPNNIASRTDDFTIIEKKAKTELERGYPNRIARQLGIPLLIPVFPRSASQKHLYTHALDRDSLLVKEGQLCRVDLQLITMIRHARQLLQEKGLVIREKVLMEGFSASGKFVNRFTLLHPDYVKASVSGGLSSQPMLPFAQLADEKLIYPIGIYDLKELTGIQFQFREYKKVPQLIYQGRLDTNDALPASECYGPEEVRLVKKILHEKIMPERWDAAKRLYKKAGVAAQFVVYDQTYHEIKDEIIYDIVRFFQANLGEKYVPLQQPYVYHPVVCHPVPVLEKAHIKEILLRGSAKLPAFCAKDTDYQFVIAIGDRLPGRDYRQFKEFLQRAGFNFEMIDVANGAVVCQIDGSNLSRTFSEGASNFQGYAVELQPEQLERLKAGQSYTLRPINRSKDFQWLNEPAVSFVWSDCKDE